MSHWPTVWSRSIAQFERRQLRVLADLLGGDLVDGGAEIVIGAFGPLGRGGAEEGGVGGGVRAGIGVLQFQIGDRR